MSISDPRDRFFYPHHTPMKDSYNLIAELNTTDIIHILNLLREKAPFLPWKYGTMKRVKSFVPQLYKD